VGSNHAPDAAHAGYLAAGDRVTQRLVIHAKKRRELGDADDRGEIVRGIFSGTDLKGRTLIFVL